VPYSNKKRCHEHHHDDTVSGSSSGKCHCSSKRRYEFAHFNTQCFLAESAHFNNLWIFLF
jgi:hypothetical protein